MGARRIDRAGRQAETAAGPEVGWKFTTPDENLLRPPMLGNLAHSRIPQ